jgi:hypothetical protein
MDPLDGLGVLSVGIKTSFVPPNRLPAFPTDSVGPTRGDNANAYANECWYRCEEVAHEHRFSGILDASKLLIEKFVTV